MCELKYQIAQHLRKEQIISSFVLDKSYVVHFLVFYTNDHQSKYLTQNV